MCGPLAVCVLQTKSRFESFQRILSLSLSLSLSLILCAFANNYSQTGFGRTGSHYWAFQLQGVVPDIVSIGKRTRPSYPQLLLEYLLPFTPVQHSEMDFRWLL
jgi:hypothetical protein